MLHGQSGQYVRVELWAPLSRIYRVSNTQAAFFSTQVAQYLYLHLVQVNILAVNMHAA